jgi:hypothetical protein
MTKTGRLLGKEESDYGCPYFTSFLDKFISSGIIKVVLLKYNPKPARLSGKEESDYGCPGVKQAAVRGDGDVSFYFCAAHPWAFNFGGVYGKPLCQYKRCNVSEDDEILGETFSY